MLDWFRWLLDSRSYMPHGHCYLWQPDLLWLHVGSDAVIAASYFTIPAIIYAYVRRRRSEIPFWWVPLLFAAFIFLCGTTHALAIWTVWNPDYRLDGFVKLLTAFASAATALSLWQVMPRAMTLRTGLQLEHEVATRTAELEAANARLQSEIAARAVADEALRRSEERFRLAARALRGYVYELDCETKRVLRSEGYTRLTGYPLDDAATEDEWLARVHPDDVETARRLSCEAATNAESASLQYRVRHADGHTVWLWDHAVFVRDATGHTVRIVGSVLDVTAQKNGERALLQADRRKDRFLATLAHELRNPLAPLRTGLAILASAPLEDARFARAREIMQRQLAILVRLVDDLLDVARITRDRLELRLAPVRLEAVLRDAVDSAHSAIADAGHRLVVERPEASLELRADAPRLVQVFTNLLSNAAKYTAPGGEIRLRARADSRSVIVEISDTGFGIPRESLEQVFEMFGRVERPREQERHGLGIGLALSRRLVELHGGSLTAASEGPGRGSTFTVELPRDAAIAPAPAGVPLPDAATLDAPADVATHARRRVLVVDDNADAASSLALLLLDAGHDVRVAADGLEAVAWAERFDPEVVLMDVGMPRMDGLEAAREIRSRPWGAAMRIVAITGWGQEADRARTRDAGFDGHWVKPIAAEDVLALVAGSGPARDAFAARQSPRGGSGSSPGSGSMP